MTVEHYLIAAAIAAEGEQEWNDVLKKKRAVGP